MKKRKEKTFNPDGHRETTPVIIK